MNLPEYHRAVLRTCTVPGESSPDGSPTLLRRLVWGCGLTGEVGELLEAIDSGDTQAVVTEAGDVLWYVGAHAFASGSTIADIYGGRLLSSDCERKIVVRAGRAVDLLKKFGGHGKAFDSGNFLSALSDVLACLETILVEHGSSLAEACAKNDAKLWARYPRGFSTTYRPSDKAAEAAAMAAVKVG